MFEKFGFLSKFSKNLDFGQNLREILILVTILEILILVKIVNFVSSLKIISILVTIFGNLDFGEIFRNISIFVKIEKKSSILFKIFEKSRLWSKFR